MKALFTLLLITASLTAISQPAPEITFETSSHNFGDVQQNNPATIEFSFENTGAGMLIISNAEASCGCTIPEWPRKPIAPGASGTIKVKYDAKKVGPFQKTITITSNDPANTTELRIKGNVKKS